MTTDLKGGANRNCDGLETELRNVVEFLFERKIESKSS